MIKIQTVAALTPLQNTDVTDTVQFYKYWLATTADCITPALKPYMLNWILLLQISLFLLVKTGTTII